MDPGDVEDMRDTIEMFDVLGYKLTTIFSRTEEFLGWAWNVVESVATELAKLGRTEGPTCAELSATGSALFHVTGRLNYARA